jgi:hypothetical protein
LELIPLFVAIFCFLKKKTKGFPLLLGLGCCYIEIYLKKSNYIFSPFSILSVGVLGGSGLGVSCGAG